MELLDTVLVLGPRIWRGVRGGGGDSPPKYFGQAFGLKGEGILISCNTKSPLSQPVFQQVQEIPEHQNFEDC